MDSRTLGMAVTSSFAAVVGQVSARSLRRLLMAGIAIVAVIVLGTVAAAGVLVLRKTVARDADARIMNAAELSTQLVERVLAERQRQVDLIAASPSVVEAARKGAEVAEKRGLADAPMAALEKQFKITRSQQVDTAALDFLTDLLPKLDIAEVMVTDQYGLNAVTTSPSSDFVQRDEEWWQTAWKHRSTTAVAANDKATGTTVVELAHVVLRDGVPIGVVKVKFGLGAVDSVLASGSTTSDGVPLRIDLVDSLGFILASSADITRFRPLPGWRVALARQTEPVFTYRADSSRDRAATAATNSGAWRIVAHTPEAEALRGYNRAKWALLGGVGLMLVGGLMLLVLIGRFIERRVTGPAGELAEAAEAVADGDFSKDVTTARADDEIGRLARAVSSMIRELRRLAVALKQTASETAAMTAEITASSEEMAASAGQIAHTASDLSQQANVMAESIQALASSSDALVVLGARLDQGAREGVARNARLRELALENRARLDESTISLATLGTDVSASAAAIDGLAGASEEIRSFVTLVQKLARQSKLLALNAAMEAARAGEHGHGFGVVAEEVRRLAAMSSDAAERTERVVSGVLQGIEQSRTSTSRTVETLSAVRDTTEQGSRSFEEIEKAVADTDAWTASIEQAATSSNALSNELRTRLETLAGGTESFAAAMEEVAASSQEQSASTEQIAAAASTLAGTAERLTQIVANLRLEATRTGEHAVPTSPAVRAPDDVPVGRLSRVSRAAR